MHSNTNIVFFYLCTNDELHIRGICRERIVEMTGMGQLDIKQNFFPVCHDFYNISINI